MSDSLFMRLGGVFSHYVRGCIKPNALGVPMRQYTDTAFTGAQHECACVGALTLIENLPFIAFVFSVDGELVVVSKGYLERWPIPKGKSYTHLWPKECVEAWTRNNELVMRRKCRMHFRELMPQRCGVPISDTNKLHNFFVEKGPVFAAGTENVIGIYGIAT